MPLAAPPAHAHAYETSAGSRSSTSLSTSDRKLRATRDCESRTRLQHVRGSLRTTSDLHLAVDFLSIYSMSRLSTHTTELRVRNRDSVQRRHVFCRFMVIPFAHPFESSCGGLLDAGALALLRACPSLVRLHMPGMGHLTKSTLIAALSMCPSLRELNLRGCERVAHGFSEAAEKSPVGARPLITHVDLSHTTANNDDLGALLDRMPGLRELQVNFCVKLTDDVLDALPQSVERVEALGCERFSYHRLQRLQKDLAMGDDETTTWAEVERVRCDDSIVQSVGRRTGTDATQTLFSMLFEYRMEEARTE